jgi:glycosyltransferase involved in cell wall biosynthesis
MTDRIPLISIIVPIFKVPEEYLRNCVESCLNQTFNDIEVVLVDDGSPDNSGKICDEYAGVDSRIKVIHKENGGLVSSRNAGWEEASGEWFAFVDGDDWISPEMCEKLSVAIKKSPDTDVFFWKLAFELENKTIKGKFEWREEREMVVYSGQECIELAKKVLDYDSGISSACNKLIRRDYSIKHGIYHNPTLRQGIEGYDYSMRTFYYAQKAAYLNEYFYHYRYNENSISKSVNYKNSEYIVDGFKVLKEQISGFPQKKEFDKILNQRICYSLIAMAMNCYYHPDNKDSLKVRSRLFSELIKKTPMFQEAIRTADLSVMDKNRKLTMFLIRYKVYFMLDIISKAKHILLSMGYYKY